MAIKTVDFNPTITEVLEAITEIKFFTVSRTTQGWQVNIEESDYKGSFSVTIAPTLEHALQKGIAQMSSRTIDFSRRKFPTTTEDPITASPTRPPVVNLTFTTSDDRKYIWNFTVHYAARKAVDYIVQDRKTRWIDDNTLQVFTQYGHIIITTDDGSLSDVMEYNFTRNQMDWHLPPDYLRVGYQMVMPHNPNWTDRIRHDDEKPRVAKDAPKPRADKPKVARPEGLISLPDLLSDTDIEPKEARQALRKLGTPKPPHGRWEFQPSEADAIKKSIIAKVKAMRKK